MAVPIINKEKKASPPNQLPNPTILDQAMLRRVSYVAFLLLHLACHAALVASCRARYLPLERVACETLQRRGAFLRNQTTIRLRALTSTPPASKD